MDSKNLINELKGRGLWSQTNGNVTEILNKPTTFYIGFDATADSLGVHHTIGLMAARILQKYGHKPIILAGEATASIGDPSGKSEERNAISKEAVHHNTMCIMEQMKKFLDFDSGEPNAAILVNNLDWLKDYTFLDFIRDVGKKITVNYLMAKENVKKRLERDGSGISFQEFSYGLLQGYDFLHLYEKYNCKLQISGLDNIGNICTGIDLIHKTLGKDDVGSISWDLLTCADGRKFGKTNGNTVWLDPKKTSPYQFAQFWLNQSDADSEKFIKLFTLIPLDEIDALIEEHKKSPEKRLLQHTLAKYMTCMVHSEEDYNKAMEASNILFGKSTSEQLLSIDENTLLDVMKDVNKIEVNKEDVIGSNIVELASTSAGMASKSEMRKLIKGNGFSVNKEKITNPNFIVTEGSLIGGKYVLLQKGKKEYLLLIAK